MTEQEEMQLRYGAKQVALEKALEERNSLLQLIMALKSGAVPLDAVVIDEGGVRLQPATPPIEEQ